MAILGRLGRGYAELRNYGVLGSSANIQNQGVRKGPSQVGTFFASYTSACISEHVWAHSTTTKKNWLTLDRS
jgi:hypothetical protein